MNTHHEPPAVLDRRVADLVALFDGIARTRMAGVPVSNPALRVEAIGFASQAGDDGVGVGAGILVTPWFMNLVRLPLHHDPRTADVGRMQRHAVGTQAFGFIGAHEAAIGAFAACSLFSPMFEFADQAAARATALAVLDECCRVSAAPAPSGRGGPPPGRRSFLFGRSAAGEARR